MADTVQFRRGTSTEWETVDPVLEPGEPGWDDTTRDVTVGDGVSPWSELGGIGATAVNGHESTVDPHGDRAYTDRTVAALAATTAPYTHTQSTPATEWAIVHGLGRHPVIAVLDSSYREMDAGVDHLDLNTATVTLLTALAGYAECR